MENDQPPDVFTKRAADGADTLARVPGSVNPTELVEAVALLQTARNVLLLGVGTSAPLAADAAYRLATLGVAASFPANVRAPDPRSRQTP